MSVVVLEQGRDTDYECNTRISGGVMVVGGRSASAPASELEPAVQTASFGAIDATLGRLLASRAGDAISWLADHGARFEPLTFQAGMTFDEVLAPTGLRTTGVDWAGRGPDLLLRRLAERLAQAGGELRMGQTATSLLYEDGDIVGVRAVRHGVQLELRAGSVVLADGGFQADPELVSEHIAPNVHQVLVRAAPSGRGWGLRAAAEAGAQLVGLDSFYGHLVSVDALHDDRLWPYPVLDPLVDVGIVVDRSGRRFTDEGAGGVDVTNQLAHREDPFAYVVCDDDAWRGTAASAQHPPAINPALDAPRYTVPPFASSAELAAIAGIPIDSLVETVAEYQRAVADPCRVLDVPRTRPDGQRMYGSPPPAELPQLRAIPLLAIPVVPGISFTMGGPLIDTSARVLDDADRPVAGLYAIGATCGGFERGPVVGYAGGLVRSVVTALAAAEHIAEARAPDLVRRDAPSRKT